MRLQQGDQEGYRQACAWMIGRFGKATDASTANTVAWACALGQEALPDLKPALQLASVAVLANAKDASARNTLGAVLCRAGRYKEALAELNTSLKLSRSGGTAADFLFLAMAHHRLGDAGEARKRLEQARAASEKSPPVIWNEQLELRLLLREAEAVIPGKAKLDKERSPQRNRPPL
jgi:Flp pilus assembly protein TadD